MQCAICLFEINHEKGGYFLSRDIFMVPPPDAHHQAELSPLRAVHLLCRYIRQLAPDTVNMESASASGGRAGLQITDGDTSADGAPYGGAPPTCPECQRPVDNTLREPEVRLVECAAGPLHFACFCMLYNARRQLLCPHRACAATSGRSAQMKLDAYLEAWSQLVLPQGFVNEVMPHAAPRVTIGPSERDELHAEGILSALERREKWNLLVGAFAPDTPIKVLCIALAEYRKEHEERVEDYKPEGKRLAPRLEKHYRSPLQYLDKCKYTGMEMIRMGLGFEMLFSHAADWDIMLNHDIFEPHVLMNPALGASFTRLLLAGMDLQRFVDARYTREHLKTLRFNLPAFRAAGGTSQQLEVLLEVHLDPTDYGNPATAWLLGRRKQ